MENPTDIAITCPSCGGSTPNPIAGRLYECVYCGARFALSDKARLALDDAATRLWAQIEQRKKEYDSALRDYQKYSKKDQRRYESDERKRAGRAAKELWAALQRGNALMETLGEVVDRNADEHLKKTLIASLQ